MSEIKNGGLDQYGAERFKQQQFGTAGVEGVNDCVRRTTSPPPADNDSRLSTLLRYTWPHLIAARDGPYQELSRST